MTQNTVDHDHRRKLVDIYYDAHDFAIASLIVGQPFLGAYGVADKLGIDRDGVYWKFAVGGASMAFKDHDIRSDNEGIIVYVANR